jgi:transcriptional regulator with XRE-family HTH domain
MKKEKTIGARLRLLRDNADITQVALAAKMGISQSALNRYENENAEAPYAILLWYADYFNVSLDYIYCRTENLYGKYFDYQPKKVKKELEKEAEWSEFVAACFEEGSPMNKRLKEMLVRLVEEGKE